MHLSLQGTPPVEVELEWRINEMANFMWQTVPDQAAVLLDMFTDMVTAAEAQPAPAPPAPPAPPVPAAHATASPVPVPKLPLEAGDQPGAVHVVCCLTGKEISTVRIHQRADMPEWRQETEKDVRKAAKKNLDQALKRDEGEIVAKESSLDAPAAKRRRLDDEDKEKGACFYCTTTEGVRKLQCFNQYGQITRHDDNWICRICYISYHKGRLEGDHDHRDGPQACEEYKNLSDFGGQNHWTLTFPCPQCRDGVLSTWDTM